MKKTVAFPLGVVLFLPKRVNIGVSERQLSCFRKLSFFSVQRDFDKASNLKRLKDDDNPTVRYTDAMLLLRESNAVGKKLESTVRRPYKS